jgi:hypothetical protein
MVKHEEIRSYAAAQVAVYAGLFAAYKVRHVGVS